MEVTMGQSTHLYIGCLILVCLLQVVSTEYHGKRVGELSELQHKVSGTLYVMNENTLRLVDFNYDGEGPAGRFFIGLSSNTPDESGQAIPDENKKTEKLGVYNNRNLVLTLPSGITVQDLRWFSVWCVTFGMDFGSVLFPSDFEGPQRFLLGELSRLAHRVKSGNVYIEDTKTIYIENMFYDGLGPDAFFILFKDSVNLENDHMEIPDEYNSTTKVKGYGGKNLRLTLPAGVSIHDGYDYLSLYCIQATQDFGNVRIPADVPVPFHSVTIGELNLDGSSVLDNCEQLSNDFNVGWSVNDTHITLEFVSPLESGQYLAFGLSGSDSSSEMLGGDVIVARYTDQGVPMAEDYYLENFAQCSEGGKGVCPDTSSGGHQDTRVIDGSKVKGVVRVKVTRLLNTGDTQTDRIYDPTQEQYIIWARGGLTTETLVTKHDTKLEDDRKIQFGRAAKRNCGFISASSKPTEGGWKEQTLSGKDNKVFKVVMGPTGGDKGYKAITGKQSWGIAYYINGLLIPKLELRRGYNYTFLIETGDDESNTAKYHPFYITTDHHGGYGKQDEQDRLQHTVYAGIDPISRLPLPNAVGRYCEFYSDQGLTDAQNAATFGEFKKNLKTTCDPGSSIGELVFSPDENTPDLLYYQCYTHSSLGWKIHIVDEYTSAATSNLSESTLTIFLITFAIIIQKAILISYTR